MIAIDNKNRKRIITKILKWSGITLLTPVILFCLITILLFIPPVQNFVQREVTGYVSNKTGMNITIHRVLLTPFLNLEMNKVCVIAPTDTLLNAKYMKVELSLRHIFNKKVTVKKVTLDDISLNTINLIKGTHIEGRLSEASLLSAQINMKTRRLLLANASVNNAAIKINYIDTIKTPKDTTKGAFNNIGVKQLHLHNVYVSLVMPVEKQHVMANVGNADVQGINLLLDNKRYSINNILLQRSLLSYQDPKQRMEFGSDIKELSLNKTDIDLKKNSYSLTDILLSANKIKYRSRETKPKAGLDPSFIVLRKAQLEAHALSYCGKNINADISHISAAERSGLTVTNANMQLHTDTSNIHLNNLYINTTASEIFAHGTLPWKMLDKKHEGNFAANLTAYIGKQDLLLIAGQMPKTLRRAMPFEPLRIKMDVKGSMNDIHLGNLDAQMPGVITLNANGVFKDIMSSAKRNIACTMNGRLTNANFLSAITGNKPGQSYTIPNNITLGGKFNMNGYDCSADALLKQDAGSLAMKGACNIKSMSYRANLKVNNLQLHNFLPKDSLYTCSMTLSAAGHGTNPYSSYTATDFKLDIAKLTYKKYIADNMHMVASLHNHRAKMTLSGSNELIKLDSDLDGTVSKKDILGSLSLNVWDADLKKLGLMSDETARPFVLALNATSAVNYSSLDVHSTDMQISLESKQKIKAFMSQCSDFTTELMKQIKKKNIDQIRLKHVFPTANITFDIGNENFISQYINKNYGVSFKEITAALSASRLEGMNGYLNAKALNTGSFQLDTVRMKVQQDSTRLNLSAQVLNNNKNDYVFSAKANGYLQGDSAKMLLSVFDKDKKEGVRVDVLGQMTDGGVSVRFCKDKQILAYRPISINGNNIVSVDKTGRIKANLDIKDDIGTEISILSNDSIQYKQFLIANIKNLNTAELMKSLPFLPPIGGLLNTDVSYIEKQGKRFIVHSNAELLEAQYNDIELGDLKLKATYLPDSIQNRHIVFGKLSRNNIEILRAGGIYDARGEGSIAGLRATVKHLPLNMFEGFVSDHMVAMNGEIYGNLQAKGTLKAPNINGEVYLDSASAYVPSVGAMLRFDKKHVNVVNNKLTFDNYNIYSTDDHPFTIAGNVTVNSIDDIQTDLKLTTRNYQLINAKQTKESIIFGKLFLNLNSTLTGDIDNLKMRGNMQVLKKTNITYVMKENSVTVQNRLNDMVSFVNMKDTSKLTNTEQLVSLGGLDMILNVNIDKDVQAACYLDPTGSSRVELVGGGNLTLQYTPEEGDMRMTGRYTLNNGLLKYDMPMVPLKDFTINKNSYVEWTGKMMNPILNISAYENMSASVSDNSSTNTSRQVNFNVNVSITNTLQNMNILFDLDAPQDLAMKSELSALTPEDRSKQAIILLSTGMYSGSNGLNVNDALSNVLQKEINQVAGNAFRNTNFSINAGSSNGSTSSNSMAALDYSYKFSKKFFNNRVNVVVGGTISSANGSNNSGESFFDNISLEYQLNNAGTHFIRLFHDIDYETLLEGEVIETGAGYTIRKNMNRLSDLFRFNSDAVPTMKEDTLRNSSNNKKTDGK